MRKIVLATAAAAALTVGATAANAQVFSPWQDNYGYGPAYSYGMHSQYTIHPQFGAVDGEFVDDVRPGLKNGNW